MIDHEVIASTGKGEEKKEVGRKTIRLAESVEECVELSDEATVVKLFNQSLTTNTRNSLARPAGAGVAAKTAYGIYLNMLEANVPAEKAAGIAGLTQDQIATCEAAAG